MYPDPRRVVAVDVGIFLGKLELVPVGRDQPLKGVPHDGEDQRGGDGRGKLSWLFRRELHGGLVSPTEWHLEPSKLEEDLAPAGARHLVDPTVEQVPGLLVHQALLWRPWEGLVHLLVKRVRQASYRVSREFAKSVFPTGSRHARLPSPVHGEPLLSDCTILTLGYSSPWRKSDADLDELARGVFPLHHGLVPGGHLTLAPLLP